MADRAEDGRGRGDEGRFADPLGPERAGRLRCLDEEALDGRNVADGRDEVVVQVVGAAGDVRLHERQAQALGDPAMDLALDEHRVHGSPDVVGRDDPTDDGRAQLHVHVHDRDLGTEPIRLVRHALPIVIERRRVRVVGARPDEHAAGLVLGEQRKIRAGYLHQPKQVGGRQRRRVAGHERLA